MSLPAWLPRAIAEGLPRLIQEARKGTDPEAVAAYVARELLGSGDEEALAAVQELLARPGYPLSVVNEISALQPFAPWFTRFLFALQQAEGLHLVIPPASAPAPDPPAGSRRGRRAK